jgi:AcrR family transcriptional regulator
MPIRSFASRRERARAQAREDILVAAAEVFARRGYAAATLAELAAAAGFAAPSLYRYFESKEQIFASLVELGTRELAATFAAPVDRDLPLAARLEALLAAQLRMVESRRTVFAVLRAGQESGAPGTPGLEAGLALYAELLAGWLRRNAVPRELRLPPEVAARAFAGVAFAFNPPDEEPGGAQRARLVVSLALEGISTPAARRRGATPWIAAATSPSPSSPPSRRPARRAPRRRRSRSPAPPSAPFA